MSRKAKNPTKRARERARKAMSQYVRQRDADLHGFCSCVSCGTRHPWETCDAGHFIPKGRSAALEFDSRNVHAQCVLCNRFNAEWAMIGYTRFMIERYGSDLVSQFQEERRTVTRRAADYAEIERYYIEALEDLRRERAQGKDAYEPLPAMR